MKPLGTFRRSGARDFIQQRHVAVARKALADVERRQGRNPTLTVVDGRRGAPETGVKPNGQIVYLIDGARHAVALALRMLTDIAPVDDGDYRRGFVTLIDGVQASVQTARPGAEIIIINEVPYARRIERGWSLQAPDGVLEVTAKKLRSARRDVSVRFDYIALTGRKSRVPAIFLKSKVF